MEKMTAKEKARMEAINAAINILASVGKDIILGLGTGTTSAMFINMLSKNVETGIIRAVIPTSYQSEEEVVKAGFKIISLREVTSPDVYIDSFDQCDVYGNVIKGGGGAVTREKLLMRLSRKVILIGEEQKLVEKLNIPVPVEVVPFAVHGVSAIISSIGWRPMIRQASGKAGPVITDNGNFMLDVDVGLIDAPSEVEQRLKLIPGVVEAGICPRKGYQVIIGTSDGSVKSI